MTIQDRTSVGTNSSIESVHSASAIPRPVSGTSRKELSAARFKLSNAIPSLSSEQARRPFRGTSQIQEQEPGREFDLSAKAYPPVLKSHSSNFDTPFANREALFLPDHQLKPSQYLSESQTSPELRSSGTEIKAHSLLRPLDPPLPRSKTYNDVASLDRPQILLNRPSPVSIQLSANDKINRKRIETQQERGKGSTTMFLNTTIPKIHNQVTTPINQDKADKYDDPRYVWGNGPTAYWTGRYMALLDNLRTTELHTATQNWSTKNYSRRTSTPQIKVAHAFDQNQLQLKKATIKALRSFCQTNVALRSFELFERQLRLRDPDIGDKEKPSAAIQPRNGKLNQPGPVPRSPHNIHLPYPTNTIKPIAHHFGGRLSHGLAQNIFRKHSNNAPLPRLTKSCTTGNIMDIQYGCSSNYDSSMVVSRIEDRRVFQLNMSETRIRAIQEREARTPAKTISTSTTIDKHVTADTSSTTAHSIGSQTSSTSLAQRSRGGMPSCSSEVDVGSFRIEKKPKHHARNGSHSSPHDASLEIDTLEAKKARKASEASKGECTHKGTRKFKKSESMKKFFDTSIREVRKISRRVSNNVGGVDDSF